MVHKQSFTIDKITNSILEIATDKTFETEMLLVNATEIKKVFKKDGWQFNWNKEFNEQGHLLYKLVLKDDKKIQGLISLEPISSQLYIEMHLIENALHNYAAKKQFAGVAGNMVAFACKMSFEMGFDGYVAFTAKTELIEHYKIALGAELIFRDRMMLSTISAKKLVNSYYKNYFNEP
ncbi:MAG: hypothetical protein QM763_19125 [Agriterribacter sp.]